MKIFFFNILLFVISLNSYSQINSKLIITEDFNYETSRENSNIGDAISNEFTNIILDSNNLKKIVFVNFSSDLSDRLDSIINYQVLSNSELNHEISEKVYKKFYGVYSSEIWELDTITFEFSKYVKSYAPIFYYAPDTTKGYYRFPDIIDGNIINNDWKCIAKDFVSDVRIHYPFDEIRDSYNMSSFYQRKFTKTLFHYLLNGKCVCYDNLGNQKLSKLQIMEKLYVIDTINNKFSDTLISTNNSWQYGINIKGRDYTMEKTRINWYSINMIRFKEDWYIDTKTFALKKVVKAFAPIYLYKNKINQDIKHMLFWIYPIK